MTYAKLIQNILDIAIHQQGISMAFDGDIYELNNMQSANYPAFIVAPTQPQDETMNYYVFHLTLYYVDRLQGANNQYGSAETSLVHSAGISILGNIIKKLRFNRDIMDIDENIQYTCWTDTEIFADKANGVYCNISITVPKDSTCPSD